MKLYTIDGWTLHAFKRREDNEILYSYEAEGPDGGAIGIDVHPFVEMRQDLFRKWLELGRPDRTNFRQYEALTALDIECAWDKKHLKTLKV